MHGARLRSAAHARRHDAALSRGHAFDRAREGWICSSHGSPIAARGDSDEGDRGAASGPRLCRRARGDLAGRIDEWRRGQARWQWTSAARGTAATAILASRPLDSCGVDLSTTAIRLAAKAAPGVVDRRQRRPGWLYDGSVDLALSIFGRRPAVELRRG
jgi:hypothetical protein